MAGFVYCIIDTETTGIRPANERILSVAASCRGKEFSSFVNPCMRIPPAATKVNGISDDDVKNEPTWDVVGSQLWAWLEERRVEANAHTVVLVGHNMRFDASFIRAEMARLPFVPPGPPKLEAVDTLRIARSKLGIIPRHRQCDVYQHLFQEEPKDQHSAVGDVNALLRICKHPTFARAIPSFRVPFRVEFPLAAAANSSAPTTAPQRPLPHISTPTSAPQQPPPHSSAPTSAPQQSPSHMSTPTSAPQQSPSHMSTPTSAPSIESAERCVTCSRVFSLHFRHECPPTI